MAGKFFFQEFCSANPHKFKSKSVQNAEVIETTEKIFEEPKELRNGAVPQTEVVTPK